MNLLVCYYISLKNPELVDLIFFFFLKVDKEQSHEKIFNIFHFSMTLKYKDYRSSKGPYIQ